MQRFSQVVNTEGSNSHFYRFEGCISRHIQQTRCGERRTAAHGVRVLVHGDAKSVCPRAKKTFPEFTFELLSSREQRSVDGSRFFFFFIVSTFAKHSVVFALNTAEKASMPRLCRCSSLAILLVVCAAVTVQLLQDGTAARLGLFRLAARMRYNNAPSLAVNWISKSRTAASQ